MKRERCKDGGISQKILTCEEERAITKDLDEVLIKNEALSLDGKVIVKSSAIEVALEGLFCCPRPWSQWRKWKVLLKVKPRYGFNEKWKMWLLSANFFMQSLVSYSRHPILVQWFPCMYEQGYDRTWVEMMAFLRLPVVWGGRNLSPRMIHVLMNWTAG